MHWPLSASHIVPKTDPLQSRPGAVQGLHRPSLGSHEGWAAAKLQSALLRHGAQRPLKQRLPAGLVAQSPLLVHGTHWPPLQSGVLALRAAHSAFPVQMRQLRLVESQIGVAPPQFEASRQPTHFPTTQTLAPHSLSPLHGRQA